MTAFPPALTALLAKMPLAPLGPGAQQSEARKELDAVIGTLPPGCQAGLWLAFGYWEKAHQVAQDLETPDGSFWHAILHRREPDAWNSKYWFRQVGNHPVYSELATAALALGYGDGTTWDAARFVDDCEKYRDTGTETEATLKAVQAKEWELLFAWCWDNRK